MAYKVLKQIVVSATNDRAVHYLPVAVVDLDEATAAELVEQGKVEPVAKPAEGEAELTAGTVEAAPKRPRRG